MTNFRWARAVRRGLGISPYSGNPPPPPPHTLLSPVRGRNRVQSVPSPLDGFLGPDNVVHTDADGFRVRLEDALRAAKQFIINFFPPILERATSTNFSNLMVAKESSLESEELKEFYFEKRASR